MQSLEGILPPQEFALKFFPDGLTLPLVFFRRSATLFDKHFSQRTKLQIWEFFKMAVLLLFQMTLRNAKIFEKLI